MTFRHLPLKIIISTNFVWFLILYTSLPIIFNNIRKITMIRIFFSKIKNKVSTSKTRLNCSTILKSVSPSMFSLIWKLSQYFYILNKLNIRWIYIFAKRNLFCCIPGGMRKVSKYTVSPLFSKFTSNDNYIVENLRNFRHCMDWQFSAICLHTSSYNMKPERFSFVRWLNFGMWARISRPQSSSSSMVRSSWYSFIACDMHNSLTVWARSPICIATVGDNSFPNDKCTFVSRGSFCNNWNGWFYWKWC